MNPGEIVPFAALSEAILEINRLASSVRMSNFQEAALDALGRHLDFDAAWWGVGSNAPDEAADVHASIAYHLPDSYVTEWTRIKSDDVLAKAIAREPGHAFRLSSGEIRGSREVTAFMRRFDIAHCLSCLIPTPETRQMSFLSLYRSKPKPAFETTALEFLQALMPHLAVAVTTSWILHLERVRSRRHAAQAYLAIVDSGGHLHVADARLLDLLGQEWPGWAGADVPEELLRHLSSSTTYRGRVLVVHSCPVGGYRLIDVRKLTSAHSLSPRETDIARRFSKGANYKTIARELGISPNTARHHLREVYRKLAVSDKGELAEKLSTSAEFDVDLEGNPMLVDIAGGVRTPPG
jgi:DNA-binding CsgD family transcriptional regulator